MADDPSSWGAVPIDSPAAWGAVPMEQPSTFGDIAKALPTGIAKGAIGIAGSLGDLSQFGAMGLGKIMHAIGAGPAYDPALDKLSIPGSADIRHGVESLTGPLYEPQTTAGQYAQTTGEFAPNLLFGPGGAIRRAATQVFAPALASETLGQATKGTALEPIARVGGAVVGGGLSAVPGRAAKALEVAPEAVANAAEQGYGALKQQQYAINPSVTKTLGDTAKNALDNNWLKDSEARGMAAELAARSTPTTKANPIAPMTGGPAATVTNPAPLTLGDLEELRRTIGGKMKGPPNTETYALGQLKRAVDNTLEKLQPSDIVGGTDPRQAIQLLKDTRANYSASKLFEAFDSAESKAEMQAARTNSGMNYGNVVRGKLQTWYNSRAGSFAPAEVRDAVAKVIKGSPGLDAVRHISNWLGGGGGMWHVGTAVLGNVLGGLPGAAAAAAAGPALRGVYNRGVGKQVNSLQQMALGRSPYAQSLPQPTAPLTIDPRVVGLLSGLRASGGGLLPGLPPPYEPGR